MPAQYISLLIFAFFAAAIPLAAWTPLRKIGGRPSMSPPVVHAPLAKREDVVGQREALSAVPEFHLIASFFLAFEITIIFLFLWAVNYENWGWHALVALGIFLAIPLSAWFWVGGQRALIAGTRGGRLTRTHEVAER